MATKKKNKPVPKGKNIRINEEDYETISNHCKEKGYVMGIFVAKASVKEVVKNLSQSGEQC